MHSKIPHQTMRDPDGLRRAMVAQRAADRRPGCRDRPQVDH